MVLDEGHPECLCACIIVAKCGSDDIYCTGNHNRGGLSISEGVSVCLSILGQIL